eukprot:615002-Amphidinium_carterae.1
MQRRAAFLREDEVEFYEKFLTAQFGELQPLLRFCFEYAGVVKTPCDMEGVTKELYVICKVHHVQLKQILVTRTDKRLWEFRNTVQM